jgi:hypothetical protein
MKNQNRIDELAKEARREYYRKWRAKNPDKVKKATERYWRRKAEQILKERTEGNSPNEAD